MDTLEAAGRRLVADPVAPPAPLGELRSRMQRRHRRRIAARAGVVVVALGLVVGSVQITDDGDDRTLRTVDETAGEPGRLGELLALLPGAAPFDGAAAMTLVDFTAVREGWGITTPGPAQLGPDGTIEPTGDDDALLEALDRESLWLGRVATAADVRAELGLDPGRFDRTARWYPSDEALVPEDLIIAEGPIDPATVDRVVRAVPHWGERTVAEQDGGTTLYRWGDDPTTPDVANTTPLRPLGQGSALAAAEGWAAFALRPSTIEAVAATRAGREPSLADSPDLRSLVDLADRHGAHGLAIAPVGRLVAAQPETGPIAAGTRWSMAASRSNPQEQRTSVLAIVAEDAAVADAAMEALADHGPRREAETVWVVIEGGDDDVQRRFNDASRAIGGFWDVGGEAG